MHRRKSYVFSVGSSVYGQLLRNLERNPKDIFLSGILPIACLAVAVSFCSLLEPSSKAIPNTGSFLMISYLCRQILAFFFRRGDRLSSPPQLFLEWPVQWTRYEAVFCSCCVSSTSLFKGRFWNERSYIEDKLLCRQKQFSWLMFMYSSSRSSSGDTGLKLVYIQYPPLQWTAHYWLLYTVICKDLFPFSFFFFARKAWDLEGWQCPSSYF